MTPIFVDFETRSPVDLKTGGLMRYARHPQTEPLMLAWAFGDEDIALWLPGEPFPERIRQHVEADGIVVAHNFQFEAAIWNYVCAKRYCWPRLKLEQGRCTLAACYAMSLPGALENAAHALGLAIKKDSEGRALMLKLCKPKAMKDGQPVYHESVEQTVRLGEYCKQDVAVEREIYKRVLPLTDQEQRLWILDQYINLRGIPFDLASLNAALAVADIEKARLDNEMARVTDGEVAVCSNIGSLKEWAADFGVIQDSLAKAELNELLGEECLPAVVEEALRIRQSAGRFTSISKLKAIKQREVNGRVAYTKQFHGATTGRWAGRGVQPDNFIRDLPKPADVENVLAALRRNDARWIDIAYGEPSIMISKCLRGFIHAAPGKKFVGGDFSNVEGRGIAWLAGQDDKLDAFRECDANPDLPDMYERAYAKTFNRDPHSVTDMERQIGKVEELAFGYQGGVGAFRTMGKTYGVRVVAKITPEIQKKGGLIVTEQQADEFKSGWRAAHPKIVDYWYALQKAAIKAVKYPGDIERAGARGREILFRKRGSFLWCRLPSGRTLAYPYPEIREGMYGDVVTFKTVPGSLEWAIYAKQKLCNEPNTTDIIDDPTNTREWCRMSTYGGRWAENFTQAVCRDILAEALMRVEPAGFPVVVHTHDDAIAEGDFTEKHRAHFEQLMNVVPVWAPGFPIRAKCWLSARYIKG